MPQLKNKEEISNALRLSYQLNDDCLQKMLYHTEEGNNLILFFQDGVSLSQYYSNRSNNSEIGNLIYDIVFASIMILNNKDLSKNNLIRPNNILISESGKIIIKNSLFEDILSDTSDKKSTNLTLILLNGIKPKERVLMKSQLYG